MYHIMMNLSISTVKTPKSISGFGLNGGTLPKNTISRLMCDCDEARINKANNIYNYMLKQQC